MEQSNLKEKVKLAWALSAMRLHEETPARKALEEALRPTTKKTPITWLKVIERDIESIVNLNLNNDNAEIIIQKLKYVTRDRREWSNHIKDIMESNI